MLPERDMYIILEKNGGESIRTETARKTKI
jgi:hypothetical protein